MLWIILLIFVGNRKIKTFRDLMSSLLTFYNFYISVLEIILIFNK